MIEHYVRVKAPLGEDFIRGIAEMAPRAIAYWADDEKEALAKVLGSEGAMKAGIEEGVIVRGLQKALSEKVTVNTMIRTAIFLAVVGNDAAELGEVEVDVIIQLGVLGEIRYEGRTREGREG